MSKPPHRPLVVAATRRLPHAHRSLLPLAIAALLGVLLLMAARGAHGQNVKDLWMQNCASCHGEKAGGGSARSMLDDDWVTDGSDRAFYDAIYDGMEDNGMPPFKGGLSEEEAWALVVYLRELRFDANRGDIPEAREDGVYDSQYHRYEVKTILKDVPGMDRPWAIDFLPGDRMIVTERSGKIFIVDGSGKATALKGVPEVWEKGQGGLLDVAVHPDYPQPDNGWVYLTYSIHSRQDDGRGVTILARGRIDFDAMAWIDHEVLFQPEDNEQQFVRTGVHFGSRIVFDGQGHVFFVIGERGQNMPAQSLDTVVGKIHRVNEDGSIPDDNPFPDAGQPSTWTYGHRNPQGLSMHPVTGKLYTVEHAPRGGDELNLIEKGNNYGWPVVSYAMNYNMTPYGKSAPWHEPRGFTEPVYYWLPSIAVCGSSFYTGDQFPKWKNDLFVSALAKTSIHRLRLSDDGTKVLEDEILLQGMGRVRDVVNGPGGVLYAALEQPGRIVRISPAD